MDGGAFEHVALGPGRDLDHGEGIAAVERLAPFGERRGLHGHPDGAARIQGLHDIAAELAQVVVDDCDRDLAQDLVEIRLRVIEAVDERPHHQQHKGSADREHAPPLANKGSTNAARRRGSCCRLRFPRRTGRACRDRTQAQEREQRVERGERRQHGEGPRGFIERQPARRLPEQHGHVPAQRQNGAPGQRKRVHAQNWKSDPGVAERGRDDEAGET